MMILKGQGAVSRARPASTLRGAGRPSATLVLLERLLCLDPAPAAEGGFASLLSTSVLGSSKQEEEFTRLWPYQSVRRSFQRSFEGL